MKASRRAELTLAFLAKASRIYTETFGIMRKRRVDSYTSRFAYVGDSRRQKVPVSIHGPPAGCRKWASSVEVPATFTATPISVW